MRAVKKAVTAAVAAAVAKAPPEVPTHDITLLVRGATRGQISKPLRARLRRQLRRALLATGTGSASLCLSLTDDAELFELNQRYANEDHATDVLSFSQRERAAAAEVPLPEPALPAFLGSEELGDIVISIDTAARQAAAQGHTLDYELLHLSVHGLCHLLGYDHATPEDERRMFGYEALLRKEALGPSRVCVVPAPRCPT